MSITHDDLELLRDPRRSLPVCGKVRAMSAVDGRALIPYDPKLITTRMQLDILQYIADPPRSPLTGQVLWMILLGYRQGGKSVAAEYGFYAQTAYSQSWKHLCVADEPQRAKELLARVNNLHAEWPREVRMERKYDQETWQATFSPVQVEHERLVERLMRTQHTGQNPIGADWDSCHWSEADFSPDAPAWWSAFKPSMTNRDHARLLIETTANPGTITPSVGFVRDLYFASKANRDANDDGGPSRFFCRFYPFWDSKIHQRPWNPKDKLENEEIRLLERYGPHGLRKEHLAFRRGEMVDDALIRANPETFRIWYPFDDLTCWPRRGSRIFSSEILERHESSPRITPWVPTDHAQFYPGWRKPPGEVDPDAAYVISVDPNGYGVGRDHGSAELREVWSDEQYQVAVFAGGARDGVDPEVLARWVGLTARKFKARVFVESTGVGMAVLALLRTHYLDIDLYHYEDNPERPGVPASLPRKLEALTHHRTQLAGDLVLQDADGVAQLASYRNDKQVEESDSQLQLAGGHNSRGRRPRHHWDKVSASMWGSWAVGLGHVNRPSKPKAAPPARLEIETAEDWARVDAMLARQAAFRRGVYTHQGKP